MSFIENRIIVSSKFRVESLRDRYQTVCRTLVIATDRDSKFRERRYNSLVMLLPRASPADPRSAFLKAARTHPEVVISELGRKCGGRKIDPRGLGTER